MRGALGVALFVVLALAALVGVRPDVHAAHASRATAVAIAAAAHESAITTGPAELPTLKATEAPPARRADALVAPPPLPNLLVGDAPTVALAVVPALEVPPRRVPVAHRTDAFVRRHRSRAPPFG